MLYHATLQEENGQIMGHVYVHVCVNLAGTVDNWWIMNIVVHRTMDCACDMDG
jgi:hypothetical protein